MATKPSSKLLKKTTKHTLKMHTQNAPIHTYMCIHAHTCTMNAGMHAHTPIPPPPTHTRMTQPHRKWNQSTHNVIHFLKPVWFAEGCMATCGCSSAGVTEEVKEEGCTWRLSHHLHPAWKRMAKWGQGGDRHQARTSPNCHHLAAATHPADTKDHQCQRVQDIHWWKNCYTPSGQKGPSVSACSGHTLMEKLLHTQRTERTISVSVFRTYTDGKTATHPEDRKDCQCQRVQDIHWWKNCYTPSGQKGPSVSACSGHTLMEKLLHTQRTQRTISVSVFRTYTDGKTATHPEDRKDCQCKRVQDIHWWKNCYTPRGQKGLSVSACSGHTLMEKLLHTQRTERTVQYIDGQCQRVQDIHWWKNCYTPRGQKGLSVSVCSGHTLMEKLLHTQRTERTISVSVFRTYIDGKLIHTQRTERTVSVHVFWTYTDGKTDTHPEDMKGLSVSVCSGRTLMEKLLHIQRTERIVSISVLRIHSEGKTKTPGYLFSNTLNSACLLRNWW